MMGRLAGSLAPCFMRDLAAGCKYHLASKPAPDDVEDEVDELIGQVEVEAQRMVEEGRKTLAALEEKRRLQASMPAPPTRARRGGMRTARMPLVIAAESKPPELVKVAEEPASNSSVEARENDDSHEVDFVPKPATDSVGIFPTEDSHDAGFDSLNETTDVETQHSISATASGFGISGVGRVYFSPKCLVLVNN
ncbi:hypothetical protein B0T26DRAFT_801941 [Lasiosphaeria miniovina]|uniref:Uncharacterized protein n=1 Tax=Lasiosphaeria miniovina TaxID=1954250 RepID=A0AA40E386_9PEZI|nr:uncharacterized protein B0T26DRAFT_801941 [Lasiosphaeria miniovina]KAK0723397.1 hypothetical protein B0T26DRAFT_801941 [Lasiosphaeria miniovina]